MYHTYIKKLFRICEEQQLAVERLRTFASGGRNLAVVTIPGRRKGTIVITAGIHGDEGSGPKAILTFLERLPKKRHGWPRIVLFPILNPWGYDHDRRGNRQRCDLNRAFTRQKMRDESKVAYWRVRKEKVKVFVSLHEDDTIRGAYCYGYSHDPENIQLYRSVLQSIGRAHPITHRQCIRHDRCDRGLILNTAPDGSFERRMHDDGVPFSLCIEAPDHVRIETRVAIFLRAIHTIIKSERVHA